MTTDRQLIDNLRIKECLHLFNRLLHLSSTLYIDEMMRKSGGLESKGKAVQYTISFLHSIDKFSIVCIYP